MIRRLFKTGNSIVMSLPRDLLDELGVKDGGNVNTELDRREHRIIVTPVEQPFARLGVDEEFAHQLDEFIAHYHLALDELAK